MLNLPPVLAELQGIKVEVGLGAWDGTCHAYGRLFICVVHRRGVSAMRRALNQTVCMSCCNGSRVDAKWTKRTRLLFSTCLI